MAYTARIGQLPENPARRGANTITNKRDGAVDASLDSVPQHWKAVA
jgi:hypothetical protein